MGFDDATGQVIGTFDLPSEEEAANVKVMDCLDLVRVG